MPKEFVREVESLQRLVHPNIIRILGVFVGKSHINIVYPFYEKDLAQYIEEANGPINKNTICSIMKQILEALSEMHSTGLIHRDLKPSNVLLNVTGDKVELVISDFGQCRPFKTKEAMMSVDVGTKWYKAPEILYGSRNYDEKVDIWSLGCIFAELIDTTPLFTGFNDIDQISKI